MACPQVAMISGRQRRRTLTEGSFVPAISYAWLFFAAAVASAAGLFAARLAARTCGRTKKVAAPETVRGLRVQFAGVSVKTTGGGRSLAMTTINQRLYIVAAIAIPFQT